MKVKSSVIKQIGRKGNKSVIISNSKLKTKAC